MSELEYVIVGGGMTAQAAAGGIRSVDRNGSVLILTDEPEGPYARPPLSKAVWGGQSEASLTLPLPDGVALRTGVRVAAIARGGRRVVLEDGEAIGYRRLLLATGGAPRRLPHAPPGVVYYRTLADYRRVRALPVGKHVVVVGGGFIGSEMAASLTGAGYRVTMIFPEPGIGARTFPAELSAHLNAYYAERGVEVRAGEPVGAIVEEGGAFVVRTPRGEVRADLVVAGLGIVPNERLAADAGLAVRDGIVVDERLRTSDPSILAAGDVARYPDAALGTVRRVEHEDNAVKMGWEAGRQLAGADGAYRHLPFFYSDLFDLGYEAVGDLDPRQEVVARWEEPFRSGMVYYLSGGRVRGVLAWGLFGKMDAARALIEGRRPIEAGELRADLA